MGGPHFSPHEQISHIRKCFFPNFFCKNTRIIFYKRAKVSASPVLCWFFILHWDSCRLSVCYYSGTDIYHCAENQWCTLLYLEGDNCGFSAFQVVPKTFANVFTNRNLQIYSKQYFQKYEQEYLHPLYWDHCGIFGNICKNMSKSICICFVLGSL